MESAHEMNNFSNGPVKPACYPVTEKPSTVSTPPKTFISYKKTASTSSFEKAYNFFTSLPVSSALLALLISQGASVNNSMWYINYLALAAILLTCIAVGISYLSVPASHRFCESVFLTLYTPASQVLNINVSLHDSHDEETNKKNALSNQETCTFIKQGMLVAAVAAATYGLTFFSALYVLTITSIYYTLSTQLSRVYDNNARALSGKRQVKEVPQAQYTKITLMCSLVAVDIYICGLSASCSLLYFLSVDSTIRRVAADVMENRNIEIMEGLDKYFTEGVFQLSEVTVVIGAIILNPYLCLLYLPVFYFNIYFPIFAFKRTCAKIQNESLCLSNFPKATASDLVSYDDICAVCLCSMKYARVTPCKHIFHGKCLKDCLIKKAQCPMCNAQVL